MNLIIGLTGKVGCEFCRLIAAEGKPFRVMVREASDPVLGIKLKHI